MLQDGAVDGEHNDQRRRYIDRDTEDTLERDEQMANQARDVETAMRPGRRQIRAEHRIGDEQHRHDWHYRSRSATGGFQHYPQKDAAEYSAPALRDGGAVEKTVAPRQRIDDDANAGQRRDHV